jgi:protein-tyrosine phosphatase
LATILVVCTANVARSPLAHVMLAASVDVEVASAGTQAREGDPAAVRSQELAAARGLDLTEHRSKPVVPSAIEAAHLVVTMSERQRDHCGILVPDAGPKVFTLRELVRLLAASGSEATTAAMTPTAIAQRAHLARPSAPRSWRAEDVDDPIQDPWPAWVTMAANLDQLLTPVLAALGREPGWTSPDADGPARRADAGTDGRSGENGDRRRWWWQTRSAR